MVDNQNLEQTAEVTHICLLSHTSSSLVLTESNACWDLVVIIDLIAIKFGGSAEGAKNGIFYQLTWLYS